jgi:hypothetical protein
LQPGHFLDRCETISGSRKGPRDGGGRGGGDHEENGRSAEKETYVRALMGAATLRRHSVRFGW